MKELFYSGLGLSLVISGFILIASLSSSLAPRARSQDVLPPPADMPIDLQALPPAPDGAPVFDMPPLEGGDPGGFVPPEGLPANGQPAPIVNDTQPLRQDPFVPIVIPGRQAPIAPGVNVAAPEEDAAPAPGDEFYDATDPWRSHYLKEYKLSGVIWDVSQPKALFKNPEGKMLTLRRKSILGREGSVVIAVRESEVIFLQPGPGGDYEKGTVKILSLRK